MKVPQKLVELKQRAEPIVKDFEWTWTNAVVFSVGLAFFSEYMAQDISTPEGAEKRLGIPVLATIKYKGRMNSRP